MHLWGRSYVSMNKESQIMCLFCLHVGYPLLNVMALIQHLHYLVHLWGGSYSCYEQTKSDNVFILFIFQIMG